MMIMSYDVLGLVCKKIKKKNDANNVGSELMLKKYKKK